MKLHLPKLLLVAVVAAASFSQAAEHAAVQQYVTDNKIYTTDFTPHLASHSSQWITTDGFVLSGTEKLGLTDANGNFLALSKKEYGGYSFLGAGYFKLDTNGTVSKNYKVNGTLEIKEGAQVHLGGQVKVSTTGTSQNDEYTGILADKILVNGYDDVTSLYSWNATVNTLEVNSGKVELHTNSNGKYGNTHFVVDSPKDSKQVCIKSELIVKGGSVTIGNATGSMLQTSLGTLLYDGATYVEGVLMSVKSAEIKSSQITQSAGELKIQGDSVSVGGLNITQSGGDMSISYGAYHDLADYGDSDIKQTGDNATLNVGVIRAYKSQYSVIKGKLQDNGVAVELSPSVVVEQTGKGTINMSGVDFTAEIGASTEKSSIIQNGGGEINLGGEYKGVVFDIMQSGMDIASGSTNISTINVKGDLTADVVNQDRNGSIVVSSGKTLTANSVNAGVLTYEKQIVDGKEVQVVTGGSVEMNGNVSLFDGSISTADKNVTIAGTLAADNITVDNSSTLTNDGFIVVSGGIVLKDGATLTNNGTITGSSTFALMTADEQAAVILSETEDLIILEEGAKLINEGSIEKDILVKGGTLTLADSEGSTKNITMESGTIYVTGQGVQTGSLTLNGGTINFADGATVALDENQTYDLSGAEIIVMVDDVNNIEGSTVTLFSGNGAGTVTGLESATFKFQDANAPENVVTGTITNLGSGSIKVEATVAIPEPTTATLSLLALAGLCARRRRR